MANKKDTENKKAHLNYKKGLKLGLIVAASLLALFLIVFAAYSVSYGKKSYAKIHIGLNNLGGMTRVEVNTKISDLSTEFVKNNIELKYLDDSGKEVKSYSLSPSDIGLAYDAEKTVDRVMQIGRNGKILSELWQQLKSVFIKQNVAMAYSVDEEALNGKIAAIATEVDVPEKDFSLKYSGDGKFALTTERAEGKRIDQDNILSATKDKLGRLLAGNIIFKSQVFVPKVDQGKAEAALANANKILDQGDLEVMAGDQRFVLNVDAIASFIQSETKKNDLLVVANKDALKKQVASYASQVDTDAKNAMFKFNSGKVAAFQSSSDGKKLDQDSAVISIENALLLRMKNSVKSVDTNQVTLTVNVKKPAIDSGDIQKYGLNELVATGTTSFTGSTTNRIQNITVGLNSINGTLLAPGEEFSTMKRLGTIDGSTGYVPELVIKDNKTVPEFGGGLCQVSTTLFRAALNAGVEITERHNHSYRVSYYEPPIGMDATIYDPAPDFKFKNNFNSYILVQGSVSGNKLTFEFYGTKDTRVVEVGTPVAFDYVSPPAAIETPSDTLPAGTRQQLAKAHQGASAKFHYKVSRDGAILQEKDFLSKYTALPEKWLVGTAPVAAPTPTPAPTNTEDPAVTPAG